MEVLSAIVTNWFIMNALLGGLFGLWPYLDVTRNTRISLVIEVILGIVGGFLGVIIWELLPLPWEIMFLGAFLGSLLLVKFYRGLVGEPARARVSLPRSLN